ncbi:MAG: BACON domain-containing protein, partial [Planctomycetes bacterium]|nr:BACON domain-containing protein [Planctomycetota bacterium]
WISTDAQRLVFASEAGANPDGLVLKLENIGGKILNWSISSDSDWLTVNPSTGLTEQEIDEIDVQVDATGLAEGSHLGTLTINDPAAANDGYQVEVLLGVLPDDGSIWVPYRYETIQAAVDAAAAGETVIVAPGVYTGIGNRDIELRGKDITVLSEMGPASSIIDCQKLGRGFYIHEGEGAGCVIEGLTIKNGYVALKDIHGYLIDPFNSMGGGIRIFESSPTIKNCWLFDNEAETGGGIDLRVDFSSEKFCDPVIQDCVFRNNKATRGGGMASLGDHNDYPYYPPPPP